MTIFDNSDFKVDMTGKEYLEYKKYKDSLPPMFTKKQAEGLFIISITIILAILSIVAIFDIFETPSITSKEVFLSSVTSIADLTWNNLLKIFFISHIEIIGVVLLLIGVAWAIHGFGFIIIKR